MDKRPSGVYAWFTQHVSRLTYGLNVKSSVHVCEEVMHRSHLEFHRMEVNVKKFESFVMFGSSRSHTLVHVKIGNKWVHKKTFKGSGFSKFPLVSRNYWIYNNHHVQLLFMWLAMDEMKAKCCFFWKPSRPWRFFQVSLEWLDLKGGTWCNCLRSHSFFKK